MFCISKHKFVRDKQIEITYKQNTSLHDDWQDFKTSHAFEYPVKCIKFCICFCQARMTSVLLQETERYVSTEVQCATSQGSSTRSNESQYSCIAWCPDAHLCDSFHRHCNCLVQYLCWDVDAKRAKLRSTYLQENVCLWILESTGKPWACCLPFDSYISSIAQYPAQMAFSSLVCILQFEKDSVMLRLLLKAVPDQCPLFNSWGAAIAICSLEWMTRCCPDKVETRVPALASQLEKEVRAQFEEAYQSAD